jgi:hypothetical protein
LAGFPFLVLTNIPGADGINVKTVIVDQASAEFFRVKVE